MDKEGPREMQTRRTSLDHHQEGFSKEAFTPEPSPSRLFSTPEGELIALARSKRQILTENTLRLIRETLELRGITLESFVAAVRPHFRNAIHNPSGFLINFARNFSMLSRPAAAPPASQPVKGADTNRCEICKGQRLVIQNRQFEPCAKCSTPEFRQEWQQQIRKSSVECFLEARFARRRRRRTFRRIPSDQIWKVRVCWPPPRRCASSIGRSSGS
ncbi:MAG: hypothetical protein ABSB35_40030 [Bryobacteraceae bacterium]